MIIPFFVAALGCRNTRTNDDYVAAKTLGGSSSRKVETVVRGLEVPWSIVFAPDQRMFISERSGRIRVVINGELEAKPLAVISDIYATSEAGLLGITLHPNFAANKWLYACYTKKEGDKIIEVVKRFRETDMGFVEDKIIIGGIPASSVHDGCRIKFGPDKKLYVTTGDAKERAKAQDLSSLLGKTLRVNDDGSVPSDNPFMAHAHAQKEIWSYGHRNSQGLDWQPTTLLMFQSEHGPSGFDGGFGGDEINIVERGKNYGWPVIHHKQMKAGMESPLLEYSPAIAPAGVTFYRGKVIPEWHNDLFVACLIGERIIRIRMDERKVVGQEDLYHEEYGRIRDIAEGPDGALYFAVSNRDGRGRPRADDDRIMRIK